MFGPVKNPGKYVYHYTSSKTSIDHILKYGTIRFSPFTKTNDPRETKLWTFKIKDSVKIINNTDMPLKREIILNIAKFNETNQKILNRIKEKYKLLCFTSDDTYQPRSPSLTSGFHRGWGKPRMWASYGENHKGVCLMFNKKQLFIAIGKNLKDYQIFSGPVNYTNDPFPENIKEIDYETYINLGIDDAIVQKIDREIKSYFFRKHLDWSTENEYRWIIKPMGDDSLEYVYIPIHNSLSAIICGQDVFDDNDNAFIQYSKKYKVRIYKMDWENGNPMPDKAPYLPWVDDFVNPI